MRLFDDIGDFLKALRVHLFGKGIMTLAVLAASFAAPLLGSWVLPMVAIGGVVLTAVNRFYREGLYQDRMVNLYRDDIARELGIQPEEVTRAHLKEAAKTNDVIDQALTRMHHKTWMAIGTAVLASTVTWLLVGGIGMEKIQAVAHDLLGGIGGNTLAGLASYIGVTTVSATSSLVLKDGLRLALIANPKHSGCAHDHIVDMQQDIAHGRAVTKEQVYSIIVDANPQVRTTITKRYRESFDHMTPAERNSVLQEIGLGSQMQNLADQINRGALKPAQLAYLVDDAIHPDRRPDVPAPEQREEARGSFVDRLRVAPRAEQSYREQVNAQRSALAERTV